MAFDQPDTLTVFGSSRDSAPIALLGQHTPAGAVWARVFVAADTLSTAVAWLNEVNLGRIIETLTEADGGDWAAQAVRRHAETMNLPDFHAAIYLAVAAHPDLGRPAVYQLNERLTGWTELGYIGFDCGPAILPDPAAFTRPPSTVPITP